MGRENAKEEVRENEKNELCCGFDYQALRKVLHIDAKDLVGECARFPVELLHYLDVYEGAVSNMNDRKHELDMVYSRLDLESRDLLSKDGIKVTEKLVESAVTQHSDYANALIKYKSAERLCRFTAIGKDAMRAKGQMLDLLVKLA